MRRLVPDWQTLCSTGAVIGALFSPDGTRVVTASTDKTAHVWDAATGAWLGKPMQHPNIVNSAAFSRDGERAVIASADNTAGVGRGDQSTDRPTPAARGLRHQRSSASSGRGW
jgi:WD40 repeat protein